MYSYAEALKESIAYFQHGQDDETSKLNAQLAGKVFVDKYALRDKNENLLESNPDQMHRRMAREFARIEAKKFKTPYSEDFIYDLFKNFERIIPQGGPMSGIGNYEQFVSLSNCYVLESPEDSYGGILKTDQQLVQISKRRGGVGIDLDNLRPRGTPTSNSSRTSTGIVSWMTRYSNSIREVGQGGRRGALMLTLSVHHPDILDFATVKNDDKSVTGANISVKLTDEFLNAVKNDEVYELRWPVNSATPSVRKSAKARDVWKTIIHSAWFRAEPGLLFWDNILRESPADCYELFRTISTNPCLPLSAKILTPNGIKELKDINIGDKIWSESGWTNVINKFKTGNKEVFKYKTTFGEIECTENHELVTHGKKVQAKDCESIDLLRGKNPNNSIIDIQDIMDGLVLGDGTYHKASNTLLLLIGQDDQDYFNSEIKSLIIEDASSIENYGFKVKTTIANNEIPKTWLRKVPDRFLYGTLEKKIGFLRGLYTANGSVTGKRVTLKSSSFELIKNVQLMLNSIGIASYYTINKPTQVKFENGTYLCKQSYDLNITRDKDKFLTYIGFIQEYKVEKLNLALENKSDKKENISKDIIEIQSIGFDDVWDITVDNESHTFWCNGFNISNCSEIPLSFLDSCRLLVINLFKYVINPFGGYATYFDFEAFYKDAQVAQRLMDDLIDLELEHIDRIIAKIESDPEDSFTKSLELETWRKIRKACEDGRRTGLGITALADTMAACGIKYGTDSANSFVDEVYKTLKLGAYRSSVDIAKELGAFPVFDANKEKDCPYLLRFKNESLVFNREAIVGHAFEIVKGEDLYNDMQKYGRRNIALLTTAPTGTTSIVSSLKVKNKYYHNVSAGIEPVFMLSYTRKKKGNPGDKDFRVDSVDGSGDSWMHFKVYHSGLAAFVDVTGKTEEESPYFGACSSEIDWIKRVQLQASAQRHIDHAISSTINLPNDVSEEMVAKIYETAWEYGLKGITVYRDGCRSGVLVKEDKPPEKVIKRPSELTCDIYHFSVKEKEYFVVVGLVNDKPYEIFVGNNISMEGDDDSFKRIISKKIKTGTVKRTKRGIYSLFSADNLIADNITNHSSSDMEALARLTSLSLRHQVADLNFVVQQLEKVKGEMHAVCKLLARALKKYIPDGTEVKGEECAECKAALIRSEGCIKCPSCGWTKC